MSSARTLLLRDGIRRIAWRAYGDPSGFPVFFAHGNLNSRMFAPSWDKTDAQTREARAHIIAVDRPGYGASTKHEGRSYSSFADDILELAAHLEIERFAVVGYSSGGPHALAVASCHPDKVSALALVSSDAPYADPEVGLSVQKMYGVDSEDGVTIEWALSRAQANAEDMRNSYSRISKEPKRTIALEDLDTAVAAGYHGAASDSVLEASGDWGFDIAAANVGGGKVFLWHGLNDHDVPIQAGQYLSAKTGGTLHAIDGENHTLIRRRWVEILTEVIGASEKGQTKL